MKRLLFTPAIRVAAIFKVNAMHKNSYNSVVCAAWKETSRLSFMREKLTNLRVKWTKPSHEKSFYDNKFGSKSVKKVIAARQQENAEHCENENSIHEHASSTCKSAKFRRRQVIGSLSLASMAIADSVATSNPSRALVQTGSDRDDKRITSSATKSLKNRISAFTLSNGMHWIVLERHNAPVVSCHTYANVGAAEESAGMTGIAHLLEHLAFKGTDLVGTKNAKAETVLLDQLDEAFYALMDAKRQSKINRIPKLLAKFEDLKAKAAALSISNEYGALIEREGGIGLNAETSHDATEYYVSLPANKLELWMALESGRFIAPVFRELYSEKEVVKEERRLRVDNTPYGKFMEMFTEAAFPGIPYGRPVLGYPQDFEEIGRKEVTLFFQEHYTPKTLTCAIVGDVNPSQVQKLAERYFGGWSTPLASVNHTITDDATRWRTSDGWDALPTSDTAIPVRLRTHVQPLYMEGFYRPPACSIDDPAISVLSEVLSGGRLSRFYKRLIVPGKALTAEATDSYPGDKQSCLLLIYGAPPLGSPTDVLAQSLRIEVEDLAEQKVKEDELNPIRRASKVGLLEAFRSNGSMARLLSRYEARTGSWANTLQELEDIEATSAADVLRVASLLFKQRKGISGYAGNF